MNQQGLLALAAGIILFSTIEVAAKLMQIGGGVAGNYPFWLGALRFIISGLVLMIPVLFRSRGCKISFKDFLPLAGLAVLGITLMSSFYHLGITFLPANIAALVFSCNPVFVVLFAPLVLPEKITVRKLAAVVFCLAGIFVLARSHSTGFSLTGLILMLGAGIIFAFYTVLFKKMMPRYGALSLTAFTGLIGGLFLLPLAFGLEGFPLGLYSATDWWGIAYLALFGTALGYFLFIYGLGHVEAGIGSMAFFAKPFLAALFAWMALGEALTASELAGGALILVGMAAAMIRLPTVKKCAAVVPDCDEA